MKRVNAHTIATDRDNPSIMTHDEIFSVPFGAAGVIPQTFGTEQIDKNSGVICWSVEPEAISETMVGYRFNGSNLALQIIRDNWILIVSTKPYAEPGDPENILETGASILEMGNCVSFISADGKDPRKATKQGWVRSGRKMVWGEIPIASRPDGGYPYDAKVYVTARCRYQDGNIQPISITYTGTDDVEGGGEQLIVSSGNLEGGIPFSFGDISGIAFPD